MIKARTVSALFAIAFAASGFIGFLPNPLVAPEGLFAVNVWHNLVHVVTGLAFGIGTLLGERPALAVIKGVSVFYIVVAALGFLTEGEMLLGFIHINQADRWLHFSLAVVITFTGLVLWRGAIAKADAG